MDSSTEPSTATSSGRRDLALVGGIASIAAGVLHASAVGIHAAHPQLARTFAALSVAQVLAGGWLVARARTVAVVATVAVNLLAVIGWQVTRVAGISWIDGLEQPEAAQFADTVCALLGAVAVGTGLAGRVLGRTPVRRSLTAGCSTLVAAVAVAGLVAGGGHVHAGGDDHGHGGVDGDDHGAVLARPYDPALPIDLSGFEGVTPQQQAAAENLVAITVVRLPQWADSDVAEAAGFHSIGDGLTGHEHFINWDWIEDDVWLDPDRPESLVYEPQPDGSRRLVSAMYMLPASVALEEVPDIGGPLMQWHIHDDLCFSLDPEAPRVASVTSSGGPCPAGTQAFPPSPMIHVWITPHECGPFAALEGVGAGQIVDGEERLCDHLHGSG